MIGFLETELPDPNAARPLDLRRIGGPSSRLEAQLLALNWWPQSSSVMALTFRVETP